MQQILKHRWIIGAGLLFAFMATFFSFGAQTALADATPDCTYTYSASGNSIQRTKCTKNGSAAPTTITFAKKPGNQAGTLRYFHQQGSCIENIVINDTDSPESGVLRGNYTVGKACNAYIDVSINIGGADSTVNSDPTDLVNSQLDDFITKHCAADAKADASLGETCRTKLQTAATACSATANGKIEDSTKDKNKTFKDAFSDCFAGKGNLNKTDKKAVYNALDSTIYDDLKQAGALDKPDEDDTADCEGTNAVLGWILCPVIETIANAADGLYENLIQPLLVTKPITLNADDPMFKAWSQFRILGDAFLIIALLVIVFGQSIGGGLVDAYTAKKVLPRLLIAAIGINLSIYFVAALVDITNIVGNGIMSLMETPFKQADAFKLVLNGGAGGLGLGGLIAGGGVIWATGGAFLSWFFVFLLVPLFLTLLAIFGVVIIRRGVILLLVLVAPVAFALYCLPNTEQYFRKWWDLLFKTLLVYPIIAMVFAVANILSVTITAASDGFSKSVAGIISIVVLIIPLFLIPFSFRLAGGLLGRLHDVLSDGRTKAHEAFKGNANDPDSLQNRTRRTFAARRAEQNLSGRGIAAGAHFSKDRRIAGRAAVRNMYQSQYGQKGIGQAMYEANKSDSNITGDIAKYGSGAESRAAAKADLDAGTITQADYQQRLFSSSAADKIGRDPSMRRAALMNPATIGYELKAGQAGWDQADKIMKDISGGDEGTYRSLKNEFQYVAKSAAGRADLSGAVDGGSYDADRAYEQTSLYENANGKGTAVKGFGQHFVSEFAAGGVDAKGKNRKDKAAIFYKELQATLPNAKKGTANAIIEQMKTLEDAGMGAHLGTQSATSSGRIDPSTGSNYRVQDGFMTDKTGAAIRDRSGNKIPYMRDESALDIINKEVRSYERPDPNQM